MVIYRVAKDLANILRPLVGHSHTISGSPTILWSTSKPSSCNRRSAFHSMMWRPSSHLYQWTLPSPQSSTNYNKAQSYITGPLCPFNTLLHYWEFFPQNTCFLFQGKYNKLVHDVAMGSPISPIVANLFMVDCESKAISTVPPIHPSFGSGIWITLLSSNRQNTANSSYNTLIPLTHISSSPKRSLAAKISSLSWTP